MGTKTLLDIHRENKVGTNLSLALRRLRRGAVVSGAGAGLGVRTSWYLGCAACRAASSLARRPASRLLPSTKYSEIPNASRNFAFFSCCASAIWWVSFTLQQKSFILMREPYQNEWLFIDRLQNKVLG